MKVKKEFKRVISKLKNNKGATIFEYITILAIVAIIAVATLPPLMKSIDDRATESVKEVDNVKSVFTTP